MAVLFYPISIPIILTRNAAIHAIAHCHTTTSTAHLCPSSLLIEDMAATHGVYSRLNTNNETAESVVNAVDTLLPNRISSVDTTLSLAMNPLMSDVTTRQSPSPNGANTGAINPATEASMLSGMEKK